ncbi:MAG: hypothetical protein AAB019_08415 [Planctomycetota bacterium]
MALLKPSGLRSRYVIASGALVPRGNLKYANEIASLPPEADPPLAGSLAMTNKAGFQQSHYK